MGFFSLLEKDADDALPYALDYVGNKLNSTSSESTVCSDNKDELIGECDELLSVVAKLNIDDVKEIINCFSGIDRRIAKLDALDCQGEDYTLSKEVSRLQDERENAMTSTNKKYDDRLSELQKLGSDAKDQETWSKYNDEWFECEKKYQKLMDYNVKSLTRSVNAFSSFLND